MNEVQPFTLQVSDVLLEDLQDRLQRTRWPEVVTETGWSYSLDMDYLREICEYWRKDYDWREHERRLNGIPQFVTHIDGVDLHFWHLRSRGEVSRPLLLLHGWPGSMIEF